MTGRFRRPLLDMTLDQVKVATYKRLALVMLVCFFHIWARQIGSTMLESVAPLENVRDEIFPNSPYPRDCGPSGLLPERRDARSGSGKLLDDFVRESPPAAQLSRAHVLALRLYSTAAYQSLLAPLRLEPA